MKTIFLLALFLAFATASFADELGINIELTRDNQGQTSVTIRAGYLTTYNRDHVSVKAAAQVLHDIKFDEDAKFAVIHAKDAVPLTDLLPIFNAMEANQIGLFYMQIGSNPPTGMDIWNHK